MVNWHPDIFSLLYLFRDANRRVCFSTGVAGRMIYLPTEGVTAFTFGGPDLNVLLVTTASIIQDFSQPRASSYPLAPSPQRGQVFLVTFSDIKGVGADPRGGKYLCA